MARIYALLVLAVAWGSDATETTTPGAKSSGSGDATSTSSKPVWYEQKAVKNGLVGGAAAAGLATFAGLGISAIVQANKATTQPPLLTTPWVAPTVAPFTTPQVIITTPQLRLREGTTEEGASSISPLLIGLLTLLALCCCLGAIGFCVFMKTRKRSTKRKVSPPRHHGETQPLVHEPVHHTAPPAPPPQPSGHYEQPMMMAPLTTTAPSYAPATTVLPTASLGGYTGLDMNRDGIPDALQQPMVGGSLFAPATTQFAPAASYATGSMYAPSSVYAPATTQYAGLGTSQYAPQNIV